MPSRKEQIIDMLKSEPDDVFLRYSLAMELEKEASNEESLALFAELMKSDPPHIPSFFRTAQQLSALDRNEDAVPVLKEGIAAAQKQNDSHAAMEMSGFLEMIE